jgi:hypothetical protein
MWMLGDRRVPESDEDADDLVVELKKMATIFEMDKLSPEDQVRVREVAPGLVPRVSGSHLNLPVLLLVGVHRLVVRHCCR